MSANAPSPESALKHFIKNVIKWRDTDDVVISLAYEKVLTIGDMDRIKPSNLPRFRLLHPTSGNVVELSQGP